MNGLFRVLLADISEKNDMLFSITTDNAEK